MCFSRNWKDITYIVAKHVEPSAMQESVGDDLLVKLTALLREHGKCLTLNVLIRSLSSCTQYQSSLILVLISLFAIFVCIFII